MTILRTFITKVNPKHLTIDFVSKLSASFENMGLGLSITDDGSVYATSTTALDRFERVEARGRINSLVAASRIKSDRHSTQDEQDI